MNPTPCASARGPHGAAAGRLSTVCWIGSAWIRVQSGSERFGAVPGASLGLAWSHARGARVSEPILLWRFLLGCDRPRRSPRSPRGAGGALRRWRSWRCHLVQIYLITYIFETPVERRLWATTVGRCAEYVRTKEKKLQDWRRNLTLSTDEGELLVRVVLRSEGRQRPPRTVPIRERLSRWHRPRRGAIRPLHGSPG